MKRTILSYGLIAGGILSLLMLLTIPFANKIGYDKSMFIGYATMLCSFSTIFFAIKAYKKSAGQSDLSFGKAFKVALGVSAIGCLFYVLTWLVLYYFFLPDFWTDMLQYQVEDLRKSGASEQKISETVQAIQNYRKAYENPLVNAAFTLMEILPVALIFSAIAGLLELVKTREHMKRSA